ncbi:MAG: nucleotidyltransferase domain-containing protein, partial [Victivallaceae bacterium]|nr:nucleotidyltransferase domain-containing protein [Victivallaceae bacterium]
VFGSTARQEETPNSDVDFIANYLRGATYFDHSAFKEEISALLHRKVDVISMRTLNNDNFSQSVRKEMVTL